MPIQIQLKKINFYPGEQIDGVINIETSVPSQVLLELQGMQNVGFVYRAGYGKNRYTVKAKHEVQIFNQSVVIGNCNAGQSSMPFSFLLPASIPNSFDWKEYEHKFGKTTYFLKALTKEHFWVQPITIVQKIVDNPQLNSKQVIENTIPVMCYGCCNKGKVSMRGTFEKSYYCNGDTIKINAEIENKSSVECRIFGQCFIEIHLNNGTQYDNTSIKVGEYGSDVVIPPNSTVMTVPLSFVLTTGDNMPTCVGGNIIKAEYKLMIRAKANTGVCECCNANPFLFLPILVYHRAQEYKPTPFEVSNWNPQNFQPVVFKPNLIMKEVPNKDHQSKQILMAKEPAKMMDKF